jgi:hypothetical protein
MQQLSSIVSREILVQWNQVPDRDCCFSGDLHISTQGVLQFHLARVEELAVRP